MNIPNILQFIKKCSKDTILKKYFAENKHLESLNNNAAKSSYRADYLSKLNANTALSKEKRGIPTFVIDSANFSERDTVSVIVKDNEFYHLTVNILYRITQALLNHI
jgi:hypothetical protein